MNGFTKLVSARLKTPVAGPHPDPDMLAGFAENALRDSERKQLLQHLGDCSDCREIVYLAMPDFVEAQKVLYFSKPRWGFVTRYGMVAAAVVVAGAVSFVSLKKTPQPAASPSVKVATSKVPAEVDQMRRDEGADQNEKIEQYAYNQPKQLAPLKHMTAKPDAKLSFEDSGQVRVGSPSAPMPNAEAQNLRAEERSVTAVPAQAAASPAPIAKSAAVAGKDEPQAGYFDALSAAKQGIAGNLGGVVVDRTGASVANAKISTRGPAGSRALTSDSEGRFDFNQLTPGSYSVRAQAPGFKTTEVQQVEVAENKAANLKLTLDVGATSEAVEVTGAPAMPQALSSNAIVNEQVSLDRMQTAKVIERKGKSSLGNVAALSAMPMAQWTLSPEGKLQRSLDGGKNWQLLTSAPGGSFRALSASGADIWVGGNGGTLLHSTDSGVTWTPVHVAAGGQRLTADVSHIDFTDSTNGAVTAATREVWTTSDGGKTWTRK